MRMHSVHKSAHHEAICSLGPGWGRVLLVMLNCRAPIVSIVAKHEGHSL